MILEDFSKRKQDYKMKKIKHYSTIFRKKIKYDTKIKMNKSESKKIVKNIEDIDKEYEKIFRHYYKVEKELIQYIAELNVKNYENEANLSPELRQINVNNLKLIDILKRKRIKILDEKRKELEQILENYQIKEAEKRDNKIYDRIERDYLVFTKLEEAKQEMVKLVPKFKILENNINKISMNNNELKRKYDNIKAENGCLLSLLEKLNKKNKNYVNNNGIIINNNNYMNKSMIIKGQNNIKLDKENNNNNNNDKYPYTSRIKDNNNSFNSKKNTLSNSIILPSSRSSNNINNTLIKNSSEKYLKNNFFISQKKSNYNLIFNKKNRSVSAKIINNNNYNNDQNIDINKYIIKLLKELIFNIQKKYNEEFILYSKEIEIQNNIKNLINLCVEDLNMAYKEEKYIIIKKQKEKQKPIKDNNKKNKFKNNINNIEKKLFIFSYIYDNCLNNGEVKELKRQYSMFQIKK